MEALLTMICKSINNYFIKTVERGTFTVGNGIIDVRGQYLTGQYIRIAGSAMNDGVYRIYGCKLAPIGPVTETFTGAVCGLAVPKDFLRLVEDIRAFNKKSAQGNSQGSLISESFAGYSYTMATGDNGMPATWKEVFASRLNNYRRMFEERVI